MATQSQITANQANAQHSTGPRTPAGKATVSQNRATHHLCGRHVVLPSEDPEAFTKLSIELHLDLAPRGVLEKALVKVVAQAQWRLVRIAEWETQLMTEALEGDPAKPSRLLLMFSKDADPAQALERLRRYENSTRRAFHNALKELRLSKAARTKPAHLADREHTVAFARQALIKLGVPESEWDRSNPIPPEMDPASAQNLPPLAATLAPATESQI